MVRHAGSEKEEDRLFALVGEMIVRWNACAGKMRLLIYSACGGNNDKIDVLVQSLAEAVLADSLKAIANVIGGDLHEHLTHAAAHFERMNGHRDYLVRGPRIAATSEGAPILMVQQTSAQGGEMRVHSNVLKAGSYQSAISSLYDLEQYQDQLVSIIRGLPTAPPATSLEKPDLPPDLPDHRGTPLKAPPPR